MSGSDWFDDLVSPWRAAPVGYFFDVVLGKMLNSSKKAEGELQAPYLAAGSIQPEQLVLDELKTMAFTEAELSQYDLRKGDVVVVEGGAGYGRSHLLARDLPGWGFQNHVARLRERGPVRAGFLLYCLKACLLSGFIEANNRTATLPSLSRDVLRALPIPVPPLDEQRAIADYLDRETARIDMLIEEQGRLIEMLLERRGAVADQLLNPPGPAQPLKRLVTDVTVGIVVNPSAWYAESGVVALRGLNIRPGRVTANDIVYLTPEGDERHSKSRLRAGDVVMVRTGQAGAAAVVPPELHGANAIDLLIVRPGPKADPNFLTAYFNAPSTRERIAHGSVGAIQGHFNVSALRELELPAFGLDEQQDRAEKWSLQAAKIDDLIAETETFIELSRERRSALITAAVTGHIDVRGAA